MRKQFNALLALFSAATLVACGGTATSSGGQTSKSTEPTTTSEAPAPAATSETPSPATSEAPAPQSSSEEKKEETKADYTAEYLILGEDDEAVSIPQRTPITADTIAAAWGGSFGSFVDQVTSKAELTLDRENNKYTYVYNCYCGTTEMGYMPVYTFEGNIEYISDTVIQVSAPTYAEEVVHAYGQFATNAEQTGYFGTDGTVSKSTDTSSAYACVAYGEQLLGLMSAGTFIVSDTAILGFAKGISKYTNEYVIMPEDADEDAELAIPSTTPINQSSIAAAWGGSFASFVDSVNSRGTLQVFSSTDRYGVTTTTYGYIYECKCGSTDNGYYPTYAWWGTCSVDGSSVVIEAPTYAVEVVNAYGQFATNAEQTGYFGTKWMVSTSESEMQCYCVQYGQQLLGLVSAGTFTVADGAVTAWAAAEATAE